jgi:hypothetical protein
MVIDVIITLFQYGHRGNYHPVSQKVRIVIEVTLPLKKTTYYHKN